MTPSKKNRKRDTETRREERVLVVSLLILYAVFVYSAFVKCDFFWGINYLFYFPAWIKLTFVILGGLCFVPEFNSIFHSAFSNLAQIIAIIYRYKKQNAVYQIIFYSIFVAGFAFVFYHFRIYSLYHAPMGAVYFMERNIPIVDYYKQWILVEDKYSLLLLWAAARYLFKQVLNFTNYQSLAATSVLFGIFFMLLLQYFISRLREYNPFEKLLIFLLIFTQGITYYFFGFANYYAPLPVVIFAYVVAVILYFRGEAGIYVPLFLGIFAVIVHLGAVFILPSMVFIMLHRFRSSFDFLYALATFRNYRKSLYALVSVIILGYVLIAIGMPYSRALSEYFVPPFVVTERYGFPLFSMQYVIHLVNMLLLSSPVGIVLFIIYLNRIQKSEIFHDGKYALLWIAIAGVLHQVFLLPQTIFAWDVYAWTSIGYTVLGSFLLIRILKVIKKRGYYATIVAAHCSIYFISWILLNSNPYASVLNYLDTAQKYDPQFAWCLQIINEDFRDEKRIAELMEKVKDRIESDEECLAITFIYDKLRDMQNTRRYHDLYMEMLSKKITNEPNNAGNYYKMIRGINSLHVDDREKWRPRLISLYDRLVELEPKNSFYLGIAGRYCMAENRNEDARKIFLKMDSLYSAEAQSLFHTTTSHFEVKASLCDIYYFISEYAKCIYYFREAVRLGMNVKHDNYTDCIIYCIDSYHQLGNQKMVNALFRECDEKSIIINLKPGMFSDKDLLINRVLASHMMLQKMQERKWMEFYQMFKYANEDSLYQEFNCLKFAYFLMDRKYDSILQALGANNVQSDDNAITKILCLIGMKQYDKALSLVNRMDIQARGIGWLKPYIYFLDGRVEEFNAWAEANLKSSMNRAKNDIGFEFISHLHLTGIPVSEPNGNFGHYYLLPGIEGVLNNRNIPETLRRNIGQLMDEINAILTDIIIFKDIENTPSNERIRVVIQRLNNYILLNRCPEFLDYFTKNYHLRERIYRSIPKDRIAIFAEKNIFPYAQNLIIRQEGDSLEAIAQEMIDVFPSLFEGYFLKGIFYKSRNNFAEAKKSFEKALSLLESSLIFGDNEAVKNRIRQIVAEIPQ